MLEYHADDGIERQADDNQTADDGDDDHRRGQAREQGKEFPVFRTQCGNAYSSEEGCGRQSGDGGHQCQQQTAEDDDSYEANKEEDDLGDHRQASAGSILVLRIVHEVVGVVDSSHEFFVDGLGVDRFAIHAEPVLRSHGFGDKHPSHEIDQAEGGERHNEQEHQDDAEQQRVFDAKEMAEARHHAAHDFVLRITEKPP